MRVAEFGITLLLVGLTTAYPQYAPGEDSQGLVSVSVIDTGCPVFTHDCVPYYQCNDGVINTDGAGLIDVRVKPRTECTVPDAPEVPGLCCRIPGATPPPIPEPIQTCPNGLTCLDSGLCHGATPGQFTTGLVICQSDPESSVTKVCCNPPPPPPPPVDFCPGNQVCSFEVECSVNEGGNTAGSSTYNDCFIDKDANTIGVCCEPSTRVLEACPADSVCIPETLCQGEILDDTDKYHPYENTGKWSQCLISGGFESNGVCCRNPVIPDPFLNPSDKCGVRNYGLDVRSQVKLNKNEAQFGEFPWQAVLFFSNFTFKCGASLVGDRWLLTGAHCVAGYQYGDFKVRLGEWQVDRYDEPLPYVDYDVVSITVHPEFRPDNLFNDVAVIELTTPVSLEYHINTVCLPSSQQVLQPGTRCFASGWGKDAFEGQYQAILKKVEVPFVEHKYCQDLLRRTRLGKYFQLHESFMCAGGEENQDACTGDGGGPLVCEDPTTGTYFLHGITAWGINCGQIDVPGVYCDVRYFADWISNIIYGSPVAQITDLGNAYGTPPAQ